MHSCTIMTWLNFIVKLFVILQTNKDQKVELQKLLHSPVSPIKDTAMIQVLWVGNWLFLIYKNNCMIFMATKKSLKKTMTRLSGKWTFFNQMPGMGCFIGTSAIMKP